MKSMAWKMLAAGGILATAACGAEGEGTKNPGGEPVAELHGEVRGNTGGAQLVNPSVGLVWARFDTVTGEPVLATDVAALPGGDGSSFSLPVFGSPAADMVEEWDLDSDGTADIRLAFGFLFGFEDVNGDGSVALNELGVDAPDRVFGFTWEHSLLWVDQVMNPAALGTIFANPADVVAGQMLLTQWNLCDFNYSIVPMSTEVVLYTFAPSSNVPQDADPFADLECPGWENPGTPTTGICGADPSSEGCQACLDRAFLDCQDNVCAAESTAFMGCAQDNGCLDQADGSCIEDHCLTEAEALYGCISTCTGWEACYEDAAE